MNAYQPFRKQPGDEECSPPEVGPVNDLVPGEVLNSGHDLESAISTIVEASRRAEGLTLLILQAHLRNLCRLQLQYLSPAEYYETSTNSGVL